MYTPVSLKLSIQLWNEGDKIRKYTESVLRHTRRRSPINYIMSPFMLCPNDPLLALFFILTFQDVVVLLRQGEIDKAKLLTDKWYKFAEAFKFDGQRDLIESGRLLSSGK